MLVGATFTLLVGLALLPSAIADTVCSATIPCETGCCGEYGVCGMGPTYCAANVCINNCDAKAECNPSDWPSEYVNATTCPLNVCCSKYGFCGTTEEFCGTKTVTVPSCDSSTQSITRVIGYYNSAAASRDCGGMAPYSIPQGVYSHIYFAFGSIDPDTFEVIPAEQSDVSLYPQLEALRMRDLDQELWISIGGWVFSDSNQPTATAFSDLVAADKTKQNVFFKSLINFMGTYGFTGIDIDWEYPVASDRNGRAEDYQNYPTFLANLKKALSDYKYGLSITLPTSYWYLQHFNLTAIEPSVDWFNVMTYDLHGTWDLTDIWTGPYLDAHSNLTEIKSALDLLWGVNITASKVNLGMAFYGRSFTIESSSCSSPGCGYLSADTAGNCSQSAGILFNSEIEALISDQDLTATLYKDAAVKTITWDTDQWVSFDDEETMKLKADYAKSICLGGIMVWAVDEDDDTHTYSNALAAALGNTVNLNTSTGVSLTISDKSTTTSSSSIQGNYCRFINCGEVCPSGFSEITREDNKKELMLDSSECPPTGSPQTQTLCCPTSSKLPSCRWRGFNGGKCKGGCESGEAEVGTITSGCRSGYQSACCEITESTKPWSECAWTSNCESDNTCPSGYDQFVVGSRQGWGGRKTCTGSNTYNYCCESSIPDAFTNCAWTGHQVMFINTAYCSDACPSGSIRIAEESVAVIMGGNREGKTESSPCWYGSEAYCCKGTTTTSTITTRSSPTIFADQTAYEFHYYLDAWLSNPTCTAHEDAEYSASFSKRDLYERDSSFTLTDQKMIYAYCVKYLVIWATSSIPRSDLTADYNHLMSTYGYADEAATITNLTNTMYTYGDWTGSPVWDPTALISEVLCDIANSRDGVENLSTATELLCESPTTSSVSKRMFDEVSQTARSANGDQPTIITALRGVLNGDLAFHYMRWISTDTVRNRVDPEVILELAFWIGPTPGTAPTTAMLETYGDSGDTVHPDLWVIFHIHIPRIRSTFRENVVTTAGGLSPAVSAIGVHHSQTLHYLGNRVDPRAEFRYSRTYARGIYNTGEMTSYNSRGTVIQCPPRAYWQIGVDNTERLARGSTTGYAQELNSFGMWLSNQGILSNTNLGYIWPAVGSIDPGWDFVTPNGASGYSPTSDAFIHNTDGSGNIVDIQSTTSNWT